MARLPTHQKDCVVLLGNAFTEVHELLDSTYDPDASIPDKLNHRDKYHNMNGVKEAFKKFGNKGALAAIIHILRDNEAIRPTADEVEDVIRNGRF